MLRCISLAGQELCSCVIDDISAPCHELPNKLRDSSEAMRAQFVTEDAREIPSVNTREYEEGIVEFTIELHEGKMDEAEEEIRSTLATKGLHDIDGVGEPEAVDAQGKTLDLAQ